MSTFPILTMLYCISTLLQAISLNCYGNYFFHFTLDRHYPVLQEQPLKFKFNSFVTLLIFFYSILVVTTDNSIAEAYETI